MTPQVLLKSLVYLDRDFISDCYEACEGVNPQTLITKNQGKKAGASLIPFSAEISAQETRAFSVSTFEMLRKLWPNFLENEPFISSEQCAERSPSVFGWLDGRLSTLKIRRAGTRQGEKEVPSDSNHFVLHDSQIGRANALITAPEYFSAGFDALLQLQETLLNKFSLPVAIYAKVLPATDHRSNWIAVPLVIVETTPEMVKALKTRRSNP